MSLGVAVHKLEARRQVIDALQFELRTARGKIDDLAFDRLRIRAEQESPDARTNPFGATGTNVVYRTRSCAAVINPRSI
jgi:hypothetical protein